MATKDTFGILDHREWCQAPHTSKKNNLLKPRSSKRFMVVRMTGLELTRITRHIHINSSITPITHDISVCLIGQFVCKHK